MGKIIGDGITFDDVLLAEKWQDDASHIGVVDC